MLAINFNSGGIGSYIAGKRAVAKYGADNVIHLFADTKSEDPDLYRFLRESCAQMGGALVEIADGRNLWELFNQENLIGNSLRDVCSRVLKRELSRKWVDERYQPSKVVLFFGIDHSESHRTSAIAGNWRPYRVEFPLCWPPFMAKYEMIAECERDGIEPPCIYDEGFPHNNCNGFCVKGGHSHFLHLLTHRPHVFYENADKEQAFRERSGFDVAVMKEQRDGVVKPLTMHRFALEVLSGERTVRGNDWGKGCECFVSRDESLSPVVGGTCNAMGD